MQNYFVLLTTVGQARLSEVIAADEPLNMSYIKLGDGGKDEGLEVTPKETDTQLKRVRAEVPINEVFQHDSNNNWVVFQAVISDEIGGFYITELGLYDDQNNLIAIGKYPKTYKAKLPDGIATSMTLDVICQVGNAENVTLTIDPSKVIATVDYVDNKYVPKTGGTFEGDLTCRGVINAGGIYLNNQPVVMAHDRNGSNVDHFWHEDDNTGNNTGYNGAWHFCSDVATKKSPGNSRIQAGGYTLANKGQLTHLKTGETFSSYATPGLTIETKHGKSSIGMARSGHCHFATEAPNFYFDKDVVVKGELYAGPSYNKRVFRDGDQTDAINDRSSDKLATARAVRDVNITAEAALPKSGGAMTGSINFPLDLYEGRYAINLNNSDIVGINSLYSKDTAQSKAEGLIFPKENNISHGNTMDWSKWMSLRCYNNHALFWDGTGDRKIYHEGFKPTKANVGLGNLPNAKTDAVNDSSTNKLATAKAVKTAYDKANAALPKAGGAITGALTCKGSITAESGYSIKQNGKTVHLKTGEGYSSFATYGLNVVTHYGKSSMGMSNSEFCHFATEADKFYFDKPVHVKGEIYAGSNYKKRVFHEDDQSDAVNVNSSSKLATSKAVKTAYDKANAALPKAGGSMTGVINCAAEFNGGRHALNLHNSDVVGINGLFCKDTAQSKGEGLVFPKVNNIVPSKDMNWSQWMSLRCHNNNALFWDGTADRRLYHEGHKPSWNEVTHKPPDYKPSPHNHDDVYLRLDHVSKTVWVDVTSKGRTGDAYTALAWAKKIHPASNFRDNDYLVVLFSNSHARGTGNGTTYWTSRHMSTFLRTRNGWHLISTQNGREPA